MDNIVRKLRIEKGWSQQHLAEAAAISRATVQRIETGKSTPDRETAQSLAAALGVEPNSIRYGAGLTREVLGMAALLRRRDATEQELSRLPPQVREVFADFQTTRTALNLSVDELKQASERTTSAMEIWHDARTNAHREHMDALKVVMASPRDPIALQSFVEANSRYLALGRAPSYGEFTDGMRQTQDLLTAYGEAAARYVSMLFRFEHGT
jgi:putative transcriptional regulator